MKFVKSSIITAVTASILSLVSVTSHAQNLTSTISPTQTTYYFPANTPTATSDTTRFSTTQANTVVTGTYAVPMPNTIVMSSGVTQYNPAAGTGFAVAPVSPTVQGLIAKAKTLIGLPYRWGGNSPVSGFDCSGFMQYIYKHTANLNLPRRSQDMAMVGQRVSRDALKAGDMVFFKTHGGVISHVGMYIGDNRFIHAPRTGRNIEITNLNSNYYTKTFATARRVLADNNA